MAARSERVTALAVLVLGLVLSFGAFRITAEAHERDERARIEQRSEEVRGRIQARIETGTEVLHGLRGFFGGSQVVEQDEFRRFVALQDLDVRIPGSRAVSFNRAVPAEGLASYEASVRAEPNRGSFTVHPVRTTGQALVVEYIEPAAGNATALGFDLASEPARALAIAGAVDSADIIATAPIRLVQDPTGSPSVSMFAAIYDDGTIPSTSAARRRHLVGTMSLVITPDLLLRDVLPANAGIAVSLHDVGAITETDAEPTNLDNRLYASDPGLGVASSGESRHDLHVGSRRWQMVVTGLPGAQTPSGLWAPWTAGTVVLIITGLMCGLILSYGRTRRRAVDLATEMTGELRAHAADLAQLAAIVDASSDPILRLDTDGTIVAWNRGAERLYGWSASEVLGEPGSIIVPPEDEDRVLETLAAVIAGHGAHAVERRGLRRDGSPVDVSMSVSPIVGPDGAVLGASVIQRDISARKQAEEALATLNRELEARAQELERSNAELERFAYITSHDLQEPLRAINGFVAKLGDRYGDRLDDRGRQYVGFAVEGAQRMQALIEALLEYSRVGRGGIDRAPTDTATIVADLVGPASGGGAVTVGELPVAAVDPVLFRQLLQNLITNARKFHRPGTKARVEVSAHREGEAWVFCVDDDGIGIEPRYRERIFEVFKRLHTTTEYPGTGIGLSICQRVVELHGGRIWADQSPLGRARIAFTIPDDLDGGAP